MQTIVQERVRQIALKPVRRIAIRVAGRLVLMIAQEVVQQLVRMIVHTIALAIVMDSDIRSTNGNWKGGIAKNITFIVTKDCQLACKYCYLVGKNTKERMTWVVAQKAIDYILDREEEFREQSVIWDFIGGEPFLEIDLIDKICDYLKTEMYRRGHHWFNSYRFSFSTNGINYHTKKV